MSTVAFFLVEVVGTGHMTRVWVVWVSPFAPRPHRHDRSDSIGDVDVLVVEAPGVFEEDVICGCIYCIGLNMDIWGRLLEDYLDYLAGGMFEVHQCDQCRASHEENRNFP